MTQCAKNSTFLKEKKRVPVKFRLALGRRDKGFLLKTVLGSELEGMVKRRIAVFCRANRSESHPDCDTT